VGGDGLASQGVPEALLEIKLLQIEMPRQQSCKGVGFWVVGGRLGVGGWGSFGSEKNGTARGCAKKIPFKAKVIGYLSGVRVPYLALLQQLLNCVPLLAW
jgi:hypothetical protein